MDSFAIKSNYLVIKQNSYSYYTSDVKNMFASVEHFYSPILTLLFSNPLKMVNIS